MSALGNTFNYTKTDVVGDNFNRFSYRVEYHLYSQVYDDYVMFKHKLKICCTS